MKWIKNTDREPTVNGFYLVLESINGGLFLLSRSWHKDDDYIHDTPTYWLEGSNKIKIPDWSELTAEKDQTWYQKLIGSFK